MTQSNVFKKLRDVIVSVKVEKKGKFNYLSWADSVDYLLENYPSATWTVHEWNNLPFTGTPENGYMVAVSVEVEGIVRTQHHPVLDNRNKTIFKPNAFDINTAIQRCLAKAIALHGLGLSLYTGEDLQDPPKSTQKPSTPPPSDDKGTKDANTDQKFYDAMEVEFERLGKEEFGIALYVGFGISDYKTITDPTERTGVWKALKATKKESIK